MTKKKTALPAAVLLAILLTAALAAYFRADNGLTTSASFAMGSYIDQTLYGRQGEAAGAAASQAIAQLENRISWRREHSDIYDLNASAGSGPVPLGDEARLVLETALSVSQASAGAFDPTIAPLSRLWDFDTDPRLPAPSEIEAALPLVGYQNLTLSAGGAELLPGMAVDLGAAGKGAACDAAVEVYRQYGIKGAVIAAGGSVGLYGRKPDGTPWKVSVRDPWGAGSIGVLALEEGFLSTSGSYEKTFEQDGVSYHHLLDPQTGYPAQSGLVSVTVCSRTGALSDCLATACFVLGYEESLPLLEAFGAEAVFIDESRRITCTPGLAEAFTPVL